MTKLAANLSMLFTDLPFLDRIDAAARAGFHAIECVQPYDEMRGGLGGYRIIQVDLAVPKLFRAVTATFLRRGCGGRARMRTLPLLASMLSFLPGLAGAQTPLVHRQPLETADFPGNGLHTVVVRTIIDPAGVIAPHLHAGLEMAYVASGAVTVTIGDAPPREVAAAGTFQVAPRTRHSVRNSGSGPAVVVSTYIVDSALPLVTPAP